MYITQFIEKRSHFFETVFWWNYLSKNILYKMESNLRFRKRISQSDFSAFAFVDNGRQVLVQHILSIGEQKISGTVAFFDDDV